MPKIIDDEKVYRAVLQSVIERGYAGATTKQMAAAANISEMSLFRKYGNKLQLVKGAIAWIAEQTDYESSIRYTGEITADLLQVVNLYQKSVVKHGQFFTIMLSEMPRYPELMEIIDTPFSIFQSMGQILVCYQEVGMLRQEHPLHALASLLGPMIYISMMRNANLEALLPELDLVLHVEGFISGHSSNN
jgi:AcrR family transcriptional regulator